MKVIQVMSPINYRLELPTQWSIHDVFHTDLLMPYTKTEIHRPNYSQPAPELTDGQEEYEIECVINSQRIGRGLKLQYLVKWKGYPDSDNKWVSKDDISANEAIWEFKLRNPTKEVHLKRAPAAESPSSPSPPS